jgi:hypothetical protein
MPAIPLVAVVVVTNGASKSISFASGCWKAEGFKPGETLFYCGPRFCLQAKGIEVEAIIDYEDQEYYGINFHINHKNRVACAAVNASYVFLVHDIFIPKEGFFDALYKVLRGGTIDFGAVDVVNQDGSLALTEMRLKKSAALVDIAEALEPLGRMTCTKEDSRASEHIAINGGQFFIRKSYAHLLERPLRWVEMEDEILSHDLRSATGAWLSCCKLITLTPRNAPVYRKSLIVSLKYFLYGHLCNAIAFATGSISVGRKLDRDSLNSYLIGQVLLIDPFHKITSSDYLPSSLEKLMVRARIASNGICWVNIVRHPLGWKLVGIDKHEMPNV